MVWRSTRTWTKIVDRFRCSIKIYITKIYQNARCRCRRRRRCYNILVLATVPDDVRERQDEWQWNTWSVAAARFRRGGEPGHARAVLVACTCLCVCVSACVLVNVCVSCCVLRAHEFVRIRARAFCRACVYGYAPPFSARTLNAHVRSAGEDDIATTTRPLVTRRRQTERVIRWRRRTDPRVPVLLSPQKLLSRGPHFFLFSVVIRF